MSDQKPDLGSGQPFGASDPTLLSAPERNETVEVVSGDRDPLDRVAEEFAERARRGEAPTIAEYEARFPDQAAKVRKLLEAVAMMEQMRRGSRQARFMPERIGEFRVLRELGRGGMGVVYEAVQESLWRHVAVKAIHHTQLDSKRLQRFQREAQAVAQLHHTNIVPIFGVGEHDGVPYYAMQYIKGRGLDALLDSWRKGDSPRASERWKLAARFASQAADALGYAHEQGVLHRDIKPANLLIDEHDAVWITDFGLAKMVGREELTASGDVIGTLRYLAPESLRGISDGRSDVYSLGLTLYEMVTLQPPYGDLTPSELLHQVSEGQPVKPRQVDPSIPRDLETIVLKATARDLNDRYATASDLADDLRSFLNDRPIQARRANFLERSWRWSRRNRTTAALTALVAASLLLAAIVGWVGYVLTNSALARASINLHIAEQNITELHQHLEDLLDKIAPDDQNETNRDIPITQPLTALGDGPGEPRMFADGSEERGPRHGPGPGPHRPGDEGPHPRLQHDGPRSPDGFAGGPPPPPDDGPFEPEKPPGQSGRFGPARQESRINNQALIESVLTSYDRFAQKNTANPRLQSEAAWVYFKMGLLHQRLNRQDQANQAIDRTLAIFDDLSIKHAQTPEYFKKFPRICSAINPWQAEPRNLGVIERRLSRMETILGRLIAASPGNSDYLRARMQLLAKIGLVAHQEKRADADASFREAIKLAGVLVDLNPEEGFPHSDRSDVLEAYAIAVGDRGDRAKARKLLEAAMEDLEWVGADGLKSTPLATRMESLADDFDRLGDQERGEELQKRADQFDTRPILRNRPKPGRPFGPQRPDADPPLDEPQIN